MLYLTQASRSNASVRSSKYDSKYHSSDGGEMENEVWVTKIHTTERQPTHSFEEKMNSLFFVPHENVENVIQVIFAHLMCYY